MENNEEGILNARIDELYWLIRQLRKEKTAVNLREVVTAAARVEELAFTPILIKRFRGVQAINNQVLEREQTERRIIEKLPVSGVPERTPERPLPDADRFPERGDGSGFTPLNSEGSDSGYIRADSIERPETGVRTVENDIPF